MAALTALAIGLGGIAGALAAGAGKKAPKAPAVPGLPPAPQQPDLAAQQAAVISDLKKRRPVTPSDRGGTLLTGPSGLATEPPMQRKTLLGT